MTMIETDYLVVGAGAAGMAFTDSLIAESDADVVMVDRRHRPGGHWNDAYPFVRLHQPSAFYGVNSRRPRHRLDRRRSGRTPGFYERATAARDLRLLPPGARGAPPAVGPGAVLRHVRLPRRRRERAPLRLAPHR